MNKIFFVIFIAITSLLFISCSGEDEKDVVEPEPDRYYVKYEVSFTTQHVNANRVLKIATEKGIQTMNLDTWSKNVSWEGTYGPVSKSFVTSLEAQVVDYDYQTSIHARIYVSREKEPFVIKAENTGTYSLILNYKIDF